MSIEESKRVAADFIARFDASDVAGAAALLIRRTKRGCRSALPAARAIHHNP